jgi:predicted Zn-dependent protease
VFLGLRQWSQSPRMGKGVRIRYLTCIDGLDRTVGGDPYLDVLRGEVYLKKGDFAAAKQFAHKAAEAEPDEPAAYFCLLAISLKEKDFAEISDILTSFREKFPRRMPKVETNAAYAEYVRSPQYRASVNGQNR